MPDDDGEAIAQEVLKEDANHERGERPEWQTHEGWHRREDTGRFGTAARARAAARVVGVLLEHLLRDRFSVVVWHTLWQCSGSF